MTCKNCKNSFEGDFCNNCGQSFKVKRINSKYLIDEIPNSVFQINSGIIFTIKELFTRPGHSIREFIKGKRKSHYKPLAFLLITSTIYVLSAYLFDRNTLLVEFISGLKVSMKERDLNSALNTLNFISKNQTYITVLILPLFSLASYLVFIKSKYNYFEHLIINFYVTGQQFIIYSILSFIFVQDNFLEIIPIVIGIIYSYWTYNQFFENNKTIKNIILITLTYLLYILQFLIFIFIFIMGGILMLRL
jgi:hypothetical protein